MSNGIYAAFCSEKHEKDFPKFSKLWPSHFVQLPIMFSCIVAPKIEDHVLVKHRSAVVYKCQSLSQGANRKKDTCSLPLVVGFNEMQKLSRSSLLISKATAKRRKKMSEPPRTRKRIGCFLVTACFFFFSMKMKKK